MALVHLHRSLLSSINTKLSHSISCFGESPGIMHSNHPPSGLDGPSASEACVASFRSSSSPSKPSTPRPVQIRISGSFPLRTRQTALLVNLTIPPLGQHLLVSQGFVRSSSIPTLFSLLLAPPPPARLPHIVNLIQPNTPLTNSTFHHHILSRKSSTKIHQPY